LSPVGTHRTTLLGYFFFATGFFAAGFFAAGFFAAGFFAFAGILLSLPFALLRSFYHFNIISFFLQYLFYLPAHIGLKPGYMYNYCH
jgi:hypothetical protein